MSVHHGYRPQDMESPDAGRPWFDDELLGDPLEKELDVCPHCLHDPCSWVCELLVDGIDPR